MDTRTDRGEFYPGGDRASAPAPQQSDKVDRVNLGEVGESYTLKDVKQKVNQIVRVIAPAAVCLTLAVVSLLSYAATAPLEDIPNTAPVVTNEEDSVALATLRTATNSLMSRMSAGMSELRSDMNTASNKLASAISESIAAESNRVESTYAKRSEIPAAPDLAPYALKSELPTDYLKEGDITNFATRAWISAQGYATDAGVGARIDAQDLAINATLQRVDTVDAALSNRLDSATNRVWQGVRAASNELARADARLDAKIDALELTGGMTRLWSSDATTYQDATGVVWQVQVVTGQWTVVHSWTTNGLNWDGPGWWGAESEGEDYYEGPGWYISSSTLTPMRMSEDRYESEIVVEWSYWEEQDEQEHSITTTCSRTVQWLTNAVNRVASQPWVTNRIAEAEARLSAQITAATNAIPKAEIPAYWPLYAVTNADGTAVTAYNFDGLNLAGIGATASDAWQMATDALGGLSGVARAATNYTEAVASEFVDGTREVATAYSSTVADNAGNARFADEAETAQYLLGGFDKTERWEVEDLLRASTNAARSVVGSATNGLPEAIGRKQDALPYPTNAIPFSAIDGAPEWEERTIDSLTWDVAYVTNGMLNVMIDTMISVSTNGWPNGASMFVRFDTGGRSYTFEGSVTPRLVGYGMWPTNNFQSVWWRSGTNVYVNVLVEE